MEKSFAYLSATIELIGLRFNLLEKFVLNAHPEIKNEYLQELQKVNEELAKRYPSIADDILPK